MKANPTTPAVAYTWIGRGRPGPPAAGCFSAAGGLVLGRWFRRRRRPRSRNLAPRQEPGTGTHRGVHKAGRPEREPRAEHGQHEERAGQGSGYGPYRIQAVQDRHRAPVLVLRRGYRRHGGRQRSAHEHSRREKDKGRKGQPDGGGAQRAQGHLPAQSDVNRTRGVDQPGAQAHADGDQAFQQGIHGQRVGAGIGLPAQQGIAHSQAAHEDRQHGRRRRRRAAEDQPQFAEPRHLVDQGAVPEPISSSPTRAKRLFIIEYCHIPRLAVKDAVALQVVIRAGQEVTPRLAGAGEAKGTVVRLSIAAGELIDAVKPAH